MVALNLRWQANNSTTQAIEEKIHNTPIIPYIITQKKIGTPRKVIMENLMRQGYPYRTIKNAFSIIDRANTPKLDWRSPTSINETARMIRRDIRREKISYTTGMRILIQARDNLKTLILNPRDRRLLQINQEIKTTKKLLMNQYGNPLMIQKYRIAKA